MSEQPDRRPSREAFAALRDAQDVTAEAEHLLGLGEPLLAYNTLEQALTQHPENFRLRQLQGLALARSGALHRANQLLTALRDEGHTDGETLGLLARTHKDLALTSPGGVGRDQHLTAAFTIYESGYLESCRRGEPAEAYYTGINAATMALLCGNVARARDIASEVEEICQRSLEDTPKSSGGDYWAQATLAEAALLRGDIDLARDRYQQAAELAEGRFADLSSTRRQARLLLEHLGANTDWLEAAMQIPPVLVYTGHMIDAPGRSSPRFPAALESAMREQIRERLARIEPVAAYGSAACGADILCLECVQELGGELHIVLPFPAEEFRAESVDIDPGGDWGRRFEQLIETADQVLVISDQPPPSGSSTFAYTNLIMTGLARLRAQTLETRLHGLAVWDGTGLGGEGGTGSVVDMWRQSEVPLEHVMLPSAPVSRGAVATGAAVAEATERAGTGRPFEYVIKAMLFADAVGYSRLTENQIPLFFEHYLGAIAALNARTQYRAEHVETAGDGMYMVFDDPADAAHYALELSELIAAQDWRGSGLPAGMGVRIGLHCGPVFVGVDPITGLPLYSGTHTSRTARIEPITPPGQVYASSAFAAIAAAERAAGLEFDYIGRTQLAKRYGALALYHVRRP